MFSIAFVAAGLLSLVRAADLDKEFFLGIPETGLNVAPWTLRTLPPIADMVSVNDFQIAAKDYLAPADYAYYRTASLDETTYLQNAEIWQKIRLNGYAFNDVSKFNLT